MDTRKATAIIRHRARHNFRLFLQYILQDELSPNGTPKYNFTSPFHTGVCSYIDKLKSFFSQSDNISFKGLLEAPPRHGKTVMVSIGTPAFLLGHYPDLKIISLCGGEKLQKQNMKELQDLMMGKRYRELFPDTKLNTNKVPTALDDASRNATEFDISGRKGYCKSFTMTGSFIGFGADLIIIDDPISREDAANSGALKESVREKFLNSIQSRRQSPSALLVMHQRWAVDDLAGTIRDINTGDWDILSYPAIQADGTALAPKVVPLEHLLDLKNTMSNFEGMYQQNPFIKGGNHIKVDNFQYFDVIPSGGQSFIIGDTAISSKTAADFTVFGYFRSVNNKLYLADLIRGRWDLSDIIPQLRAFGNKHDESRIYIEQGTAGTPLRQLLQREGIPTYGLTTRGKDKFERVQLAIPYIDRGLVHLPKQAHWVSDFLLECAQFTHNDKHPHDDQVDVLIYGIEMFRGQIKSNEPQSPMPSFLHSDTKFV